MYFFSSPHAHTQTRPGRVHPTPMFHSIDLFSGLGGNAYAFRSFATPMMYCEKDTHVTPVLKAAILNGHIPWAPLHNDVTTLIEHSSVYKAVKHKRPLLVSGSWPCQGNSTLGKRLGMEDHRSGLLRTLCDVILDCTPDVFFTENVPAAAVNGSFAYMLETLGTEYEIVGTYVRAQDLGFMHERKRFFCVGLKRDTPRGAATASRALVAAMHPIVEPMTRLLPERIEPPRTMYERPHSLNNALHTLGNAVVPASSYFAFLKLTGLPIAGLRGENVLATLTFDPSVYTPLAKVKRNTERQTTERITQPKISALWATPRASALTACHVLTQRSIKDLATQVRFEVGTPHTERAWYLSHEWVAWLMGYPTSYTRGLGEEDPDADEARAATLRWAIRHGLDALVVPTLKKITNIKDIRDALKLAKEVDNSSIVALIRASLEGD